MLVGDMFNAAIALEVKGAKTLHQALNYHYLYCFAVTDSASEISISQKKPSYGAGNSYIDTPVW